nr:hypothetical protein [Tanacetum cinerariifolium]
PNPDVCGGGARRGFADERAPVRGPHELAARQPAPPGGPREPLAGARQRGHAPAEPFARPPAQALAVQNVGRGRVFIRLRRAQP